MVNHVRTLLLNEDGAGEEYVPPGYRKAQLPEALQRVRDILFGPSPDRRMLVYRVRQFMAILHSTPLATFVTRADPRITYTLVAEPSLQPSLTISGSDQPLYVSGPRPTTADGAATQIWTITVTA